MFPVGSAIFFETLLYRTSHGDCYLVRAFTKETRWFAYAKYIAIGNQMGSMKWVTPVIDPANLLAAVLFYNIRRRRDSPFAFLFFSNIEVIFL